MPGSRHVEIELIERWWIPRGEAGHTYDVRDLLFEAAEAVAPASSRSAPNWGRRRTSGVARRTALRTRQAGSRTRDANRHRDHAVLHHLNRPDGSRNCRGCRSSRGRAVGGCVARLPGGHLARRTVRFADARDDLRCRTRRRRGRGRRHAVRGHRSTVGYCAAKAPSTFAGWSGCYVTRVSTARGAWRSCPHRFASSRSPRRCRWPPSRRGQCSVQSGRTVLRQNGSRRPTTPLRGPASRKPPRRPAGPAPTQGPTPGDERAQEQRIAGVSGANTHARGEWRND